MGLRATELPVTDDDTAGFEDGALVLGNRRSAVTLDHPEATLWATKRAAWAALVGQTEHRAAGGSDCESSRRGAVAPTPASSRGDLSFVELSGAGGRH